MILHLLLLLHRRDLVVLSLLLEGGLAIRLRNREHALGVLEVEMHVEDPRLPAVAVVDLNRTVGILPLRKEDDAVASGALVGWSQGDVGAEDGAAFAEEILACAASERAKMGFLIDDLQSCQRTRNGRLPTKS